MSQFKSDNLTLIHGIRGICALFVVIAHSKFFFWVGGNEYIKAHPRSEWNIIEYFLFALDIATSNGTAMVIIFFILSGFFIAFTLRKNQRALFSFYKIRFLRIYIPFLASLIISSIIFYIVAINGNVKGVFSEEANALIITTKDLFNWNTFMNTFFFIPTNGGYYMALNYPYWSLFHELIFYILAPLLILNLRISFFIALVLYVTGIFIGPVPFYFQFFLDFFLYFGAGMLFFDLIKERPLFRPSRKTWVVIFILFVSSLYLNQLIDKKYSYILAGVACLLCIQQILYSKFKEIKLLDFFRFLGKISFTLYLFHIPIFLLCLFVFEKLNISFNPFQRYAYYFVSIIAVIVAIPLYKLIEEPSINLLQRLRNKKGR